MFNRTPQAIPDGNSMGAILAARFDPQRAQLHSLALALTADYQTAISGKGDLPTRVRVDGAMVSVRSDMLKLKPRLEMSVLEDEAFLADLTALLRTRNWTARFCNGHCELTAGHSSPRLPFIPQPR